MNDVETLGTSKLLEAVAGGGAACGSEFDLKPISRSGPDKFSPLKPAPIDPPGICPPQLPRNSLR